jgi:hypothetical protein
MMKCDGLKRWLCQLRLGGRAGRCPSIGAAGQYLLNAFTWGTGKE